MTTLEQYNDFVAALEQGCRRTSFDLVHRWRSDGLSDASIYLDILLPALAHFGDRWERDDMTVTREHIATEIIKNIIGYMAGVNDSPHRYSETILIGCVPNEQHDVPAMVVANLLEREGYAVRFFGQSVPQDDLLASVADIRPDVMCLSMKLIPRLDEGMQLLAAIRGKSPSTRILVGGIDMTAARDVLRPHVDAFADSPLDAVSAVHSLLGRAA